MLSLRQLRVTAKNIDVCRSRRQQRYRQLITKGTKKRIQVVLDRNEAKKLDDICLIEGISNTEFIRRAIETSTRD